MRRGLLCLILCGWLSLTAGCYSVPPPLRVGTNVWPGYEPLYVARSLGYLQDEEVRLVELPSASDVMDALRLGHLEAGALTLDETLSLLAEGEDLVVVLVFDISAGADVIVARDSISRLPQLAGKTIAVETTAVGALMLQAALDMGGLTTDQVNLVHLPLSDHLAAFRAHRIDAAVTFEPYASQLIRAGAHQLFDSRAIPGQIVDVLAVRRAALDDYQYQLRQLISAYFRARNDLQQQPQTSLPLFNQRLKVAEDDLPHQLDGLDLPDAATNRQLLSGNPSPLEKTARQLAVVMTRHNLLQQPLPLNALTRADFIREAP